MAQFVVETTPEEREAILNVIKQIEGQTVPVRVIAEMADMAQSRARYALIDLLEARKIERVASKAINKHYVRYSYKLL